MKILFYYRGAENFGIEYISALLKEAGHSVELIFDPGFDDTFYFRADFLKFLDAKERLLSQARRFSPDLLAFSSITNLYPYVKEMARLLRKEFKAPFIIGGVHPSALPEYVLREDCFDMVCVGEGEYAMLELAGRMEEGRDFSDIKNLWVKSNGKIIRNPERPLVEDLDSLPFPDKELFYKRGAFYRSVQVAASRGCPYHCSFCVNSFYQQKYGHKALRRRRVNKVIEELKIYKNKYNPRFVHFADDIFTTSLSWLEEFSGKYRKEIGIKFLVNIHPAAVNKRIAFLLRDAGCWGVCMGIQSGSQEVRRELLKRNETDSLILETARVLKEEGIYLTTEFIFGSPGETEESAWQSVLLNEKIRPDSTATFTLYPFPGTELAEASAKAGLLDEKSAAMIKEGRGSYHTTLFLKNSDNDFLFNLAMLLPVSLRLPGFMRNGCLRKFCRRKTGLSHRILGICAIPFFNPVLCREKLINYLRMFWVYLLR